MTKLRAPPDRKLKIDLRRFQLDAIVRGCLAEAAGEPGYAVLLILDRIDDDHERRIAVNLLWKQMNAR